MAEAPPVIVIVGATAVGKTACALHVCAAVDGEIVSLDSRQLYRRMDIGTAKPSAEERAAAVHHLIDVAEPDAVWSIADVLAAANAAVADIADRGRRPVLVGGTGQYVRAFLEGWSIPAVAPDPALRAALFDLAAGPDGRARLHAALSAVDPVSAARLHPNNVRRIVRALEVFERSGRPLSELQAERGPGHAAVVLGLHRSREDLEARIDARVAAMMAGGLEDEVRALVASGVGFDHPNMSGVGYAEWRPYFGGTATADEVEARLRETTRRLVRKQALWFRRDDGAIVWLDLAPGEIGAERALDAITAIARPWAGVGGAVAGDTASGSAVAAPESMG